MSNKEIIENIYPLSPMQEGMLFHKLLGKDKNAYFEQVSFRISGKLEVELFEESINRLIEKYDILRTIFMYENQKRPLQIVLKKARIKMHIKNISSLCNDEKAVFIKEFKERDIDKGFNLSKEISIRASLIKTDEEEHIFILSFHHIILDGWSSAIILNDLFDIYNSLKKCIPFKLSKSNKYSNYIKWLEKQDKKEALLYWEEYLDDYEDQAQVLQTANTIKASKYVNKNMTFSIDREMTDKLRDIAQRNKITVNTVFQTIWGIVLQRYNNVKDVVFGAVVSGRPAEIHGIENMVGLFINTVPVRIKSTIDKSFIELVKKVQDHSIKSKKYEYVPLAEIQSNTSLRQQLIDNIMIFENYPELKYSNELDGSDKLEFKIELEEAVERTNYNFNIIVGMTDELLVRLSYNSSIYNEQHVNMIVSHIKKVIKEIVEKPEIRISEIEILSEKEKGKILVDFNDTEIEYHQNKTIHELFQEQVDKTPDNIAVVCDDKRLSYKELNERANTLARILRDKGLKPNSIAGIMMERSIEMIVGIIAILKAGGAYLPIDPEYPQARIEYMLEDSNSKILLTQLHLMDKVKFRGAILNLEDKGLYEGIKDNLEKVNSSRDLAYVIYTSGSTGKPKGVMIEHRSAVNFQVGVTNKIDMVEGEGILALTTISFDIFFLETLLPLAKGLKVIIAQRKLQKDANKLSKFIYKNNINIIQATPSTIQLLASSDMGLLSLSKVEKLLVGGEALSQGLFEELKKLKASKLYNMYGPTETTVWSSIKELTNSHKVNIGRPISNTKVYILDENNRLQPVEVAGELCIAGHGLARGYLNRPELTEEKFIPNPFEEEERIYRTGDLARWLPNGEIDCIGRIDHQVKIRGFRIELGEIENQLLQIEEIREAIVIDREDKQGNKYLCAYIICDKHIPVAELREGLSRKLPDYMIPAYFMEIEKMPLTPNGKVDRKALPQLDGDINTGVEYVAPRNEIEEKLVKVWREVLDVEKVGIDDDFFALGGHSLKAIQVVSLMHRELDAEISVGEIFTSPTIRQIGKYIEKSKKNVYSSIKPVEEREVYKVSSAQRRLFTLSQIGKEGVNYNIPAVMVVEGRLEKQRVEEIFKKLIKRHQAFRTSFELQNDEIVQRIHRETEFNVEYIEADEEVVKEIVRSFIRPLDLSKAPLLRVKLVRIEEEKYILMLDMHHIISDGTSLGIIIKEFTKLYNGEALEELKIEYKDYAVWQNEALSSEAMKKQEEYWMKVFGGDAPVLDIPIDYPRPTLQSFEGENIEFIIDEELTEKIRKIGNHSGATLYMTLLSAYNVLLSRYSGQEDIIVGSPIAGRPHADLQGLVGMLVNTLAMRNYPRGEKTFKEFLEEVRINALSAYENQDYQFDELVEKLGVKRDLSRNPLFDVNFVLQNADVQEIQLRDLRIKPYELENKVAKFDITLIAVEKGKEIACNLEYCTKLFKKETMERFAKYFLNILKEIAQNPKIQISEIDMLSEEEKKAVLVDFNDTEAEYPRDRTIYDLFKKQVERTPDNIAVVFEKDKLTYKELDNRANQLVAYLINKRDFKSDIPVGLLMDRSINLVVAILGILRAGGAYLPIDTEWPEERIKGIINDARAEIVISSKKYIKKLNRLQFECKSFDTYLCMDSRDVYAEEEEKNELMSKKLWEYVGSSAENDIAAGGWSSSYTGDELSKEEMEEYSNNVFEKIKPYLNKKVKVLEIGCASGLTMFKIAPHTGVYYGIDLSQSIIERNKKKIQAGGYENIKLSCMSAHEIDKLDEESFDIVIINSVIQSFHGHNYLRKVLTKAINTLGDKGILFIGDIMDQDLKDNLIDSLIKFKEENAGKGYRTKSDFSQELFVSRSFFEDIRFTEKHIKSIKFSNKIFTIENELTRFRYDAIFEIDKLHEWEVPVSSRHKYQHGIDNVENYKGTEIKADTNPDDLAYVIYTSGSTGKPKGVMVTNQGLVNYIWWARKVYVKDEEIDFPLYSSISFDLTVTSIYTPLISGNKIIVYDGEDKPTLVKRIIDEDKTGIIKLTPTHLNLLCDLDLSKAQIKRFIVGGEDLKAELARKIYDASKGKIEIYNEYGPTETVVGCMIYKYNPEKNTLGSVPIGVPSDNVEIYLLDKYLNPVPKGVKGEIYIAGDGLARGYLNNQELTKERFIDNPFVSGERMYKTGDLARRREDGNIEYVGRIDHQVKIRGFRIELGEIEGQLLKNEAIREAVVVDREDKPVNKYLCAYIACDREMTVPELRGYLSTELPDYMIPSYFIQLERLPLNPNGKIDRKALPNPDGDIDTGVEYTAPRNEREEKLVKIWSEVLDVEKIGIDDDFFVLGGHSLKAIQALSIIHRELNVEVPVGEMFSNPTIRQLGEYIEKSKESIYSSIKPVEEREVYQASSAQKRLFALNQFGKEETNYNTPYVIIVEGKLEKAKVEEIFKKLVERHETFRTSFELRNEEIVQRIHREIEFKVGYGEIREASDESIEEIAQSFIKPFDLLKAPLLRVKLIKLEKEKHLLMLDMHHIISDGTSMGIIIKEFKKIYDGESLEELKIQYKDYAAWQNKSSNSEAMKKQEEYWINTFSGEIPVLNVATDYHRPMLQSFEGESVDFQIDKRLAEKIRKIGNDHGATLYMTLLAAYNILLSLYSGQEDIIVGSPIAGRPHADLQGIVGMLVNTLAMRNYPKREKTFKEFLQDVKQKALRAYENQDYQFDDLVEKLDLTRDLSRNPLFDTMFVLQNTDATEIDIDNLKFRPYEFKNKISKFDLTLQAAEMEEEIVLNLEYCSRLFKRETVERMTRHFLNILREVIENPEIKISEINMLSEEEKSNILVDFNSTQAEYPRDKTIHELFQAQVKSIPNNIAVVFEDKRLTYKELNQRANQLARLLRKKGVGPDSKVGIMTERSPEMIIGILAILKAGGAYLPIDPNYPEERVVSILNDSNAHIFITKENEIQDISFCRLQDSGDSTVEQVVTCSRPQILELDSLPIPDRTLVDYKKYHNHIGLGAAKNSISIQATRGCPYNCAFCHKIWPKKHVVRTAENIFQEIQIYYKVGIRRFVFIDDIFNLDMDNSSKLFNLIIENNMKVQLYFPNGLRGDILTKEYIDLMVKAGTVNLSLALETASPRLQKLVGKNMNLKKLKENIQYILEKHPHVIVELESMHGFPSETEEEAMMTLNFIKELKWLHFPYVHLLKIYPNTDIAKLAEESGVSRESIEKSTTLAYHEVPDTLPFEKSFTLKYQAEFFNNYFMLKERLLYVLPLQMKAMTEGELIAKYDSYLPVNIHSFEDLLKFLNISMAELGNVEFVDEEYGVVPNFNETIKDYFPVKEHDEDALRILFLDLSQLFTADSGMVYDVVEAPLGQMYLLTYLNKIFGRKIQGKIAKARIDFDSYEELKELIEKFNPDVIGIRTLSIYKDFFHRTVAIMRQWGINVPIIAGGPYATSDGSSILKDRNIDLAIFGEGEITVAEVVEKIMKNDGKLPKSNILRTIPGIGFVENKDMLMGREIIFMDKIETALAEKSHEDIPSISGAHNLIYVIYTSGSTGKPKGVMLEHRNMVNLLYYQYNKTNINSSKKVLQFATMCFDVCYQEIFSTLLAGGELNIINEDEKRDVKKLIAFIKERDIKTIFLPTSYLKFISSDKEYIGNFPKILEHIVTAGEQLTVSELLDKYIRTNNIMLHNHYGPSETHVVTAITLGESKEISMIPPIGKPISNTKIYILDEKMKIQPVGVKGEMYIAGESVGRGYVNPTDLSKDKFMFNPFTPEERMYRTGDMARWLPDGNIEFLGRVDHQVKIRGYRIEPREIERQLLRHEAIKEAVVIDILDKQENKYLCAYFVCNEEMTLPDLRGYLLKELPEYMIPSYFIPIEKLPLTLNGKIDRKALPKSDGYINTGVEYTAPRNEIEKKLIKIWSEVLKVEKIGINDDFFSLGGHSLKAIQVISMIHRELNVELSIKEIFKQPTIKELSGYILEAEKSSYTIIPKAEHSQYYPVLGAQKRLFITNQLNKEDVSYNMPLILIVEGALNIAKLEDAFKEIIDRHEVFRTSFKLVNGEPIQRLNKKYDFKLNITNVKGTDIEAIVKKYITPFDLSQAPLLRANYITTEDDIKILMIDMHHIISDGVSIQILVKELIELYKGNSLAEMDIQYKDYSVWKNKYLNSHYIKKLEEYWLEKVRDFTYTCLPKKYDSNNKKNIGLNKEIYFNKQEYKKIDRFCKENSITKFAYFTSILNIILANEVGKNDVSIGIPTSGRNHHQLQNLIGLFLNVMLIRTSIDKNKTFKEYLNIVNETLIDSLNHQEYPYEELYDMTVERSGAITDSLFSIMLNYMPYLNTNEEEDIKLHGVTLKPYKQRYFYPKYDVTFYVKENKEDILINMVYKVVFEEYVMERIANAFHNISEIVLNDSHITIKDIEYSGIMEEKQDMDIMDGYFDNEEFLIG